MKFDMRHPISCRFSYWHRPRSAEFSIDYLQMLANLICTFLFLWVHISFLRNTWFNLGDFISLGFLFSSFQMLFLLVWNAVLMRTIIFFWFSILSYKMFVGLTSAVSLYLAL